MQHTGIFTINTTEYTIRCNDCNNEAGYEAYLKLYNCPMRIKAILKCSQCGNTTSFGPYN